MLQHEISDIPILAEVHVSEVAAGYDLFKKWTGIDDMFQMRRAYSHFLGGAPLPIISSHTGRWSLTQDQEKRLRILLSPNGYAFFRAYQINHPWLPLGARNEDSQG